MPTRTTLLIVVLTALTGLLLFFALTSDQKPSQVSQNNQPSPTQEVVNGKARLYFDPETLEVKLSASNTATVNIMLDSDEHDITGVQAEALFDPQILTNVTLSTPHRSYFAVSGDPTNVLVKEIDALTGKISYVEAITPSGKAVNGNAAVATLTFRVNPSTTETQTSIILLDSSIVTEDSQTHPGSSVLDSVTPLKIKIVK